MKMLLKMLVIALLAPPAWAEPCRDEVQRFCPQAEGPHRLHCLEGRKQELSPACREFVSRTREEGEQFKRDCRDDSAKLCPDQEGRKLMACLEESLAKLAPVCAQRMRKIHAGHKVVKERIPAACREDCEKLCPPQRVSPDGILGCLKGEAAKLEDGCRKALKLPAPAK